MIFLTIDKFFRRCQPRSLAFLMFAALAALPLNAIASVSTAIAWSTSTDTNVSGYNIYYGTDSQVYTGMLSAGNVTNATINNLVPDTTYYFSVKSHNAAGAEGAFSVEALFAGYVTTPAYGAGLQIKTCPAALKLDHLFFSLAPGAPASAWINPTNGVLIWNPGLADANTTQSFNVIITDLTNPSASTQEIIVVTVADFLKVMLASVPVQSGATAIMPLSIMSSDGVTNLTIRVAWPGAWLQNPTLTFFAPVAGGTLQSNGTNLCLKLWTANGDFLMGTNVFAEINFQAASQTSAFVPLPVTGISANKTTGAAFSNLGAQDGEAVVIGTNPLLRPQFIPGLGRVLSLYANPGTSHQLQYATNLATPVAWQLLQNFQPTNTFQTVSLDSANPVIFYQLMQP